MHIIVLEYHVTLMKMHFYLTYSTIHDLESQTDENTTPVEKQKSGKRACDVEPESDGSAIKKQIMEIKMEKAASQD